MTSAALIAAGLLSLTAPMKVSSRVGHSRSGNHIQTPYSGGRTQEESAMEGIGILLTPIIDPFPAGKPLLMISTNQSTVSGWIWTNESAPLCTESLYIVLQ